MRTPEQIKEDSWESSYLCMGQLLSSVHIPSKEVDELWEKLTYTEPFEDLQE